MKGNTVKNLALSTGLVAMGAAAWSGGTVTSALFTYTVITNGRGAFTAQ